MKKIKIKSGRNAVTTHLVKKATRNMVAYCPDDVEVVEKVDSKLTADEKRRRDNQKLTRDANPKLTRDANPK